MSEWAPFDPLRQWFVHPDFIVLALVGSACLLIARRGRPALHLVLFALALLAAVTLRRNIPLLAIVGAFTLGAPIEAVAADTLRRLVNELRPVARLALTAAFVPLALGFGLFFNKQSPTQIEVPGDRFPLACMGFLQANAVRGNCLVFFDWAEYAIWHLYPDCRVFLDGRFLDAYSNATVDDYLDALYGKPNWKEILERHRVNILFTHLGNPITSLVHADPDWALVCADHVAAVHVRRSSHGPLIREVEEGQSSPPPPRAPFFP